MATAIPQTENWLNCSRNDYFADISDCWYSPLCLPSLVRSRTGRHGPAVNHLFCAVDHSQSRPSRKSNNSNPSALLVRSDCSLKNRLCPLGHGAQITQTYNSSLFLMKQYLRRWRLPFLRIAFLCVVK